MHLNTMHDAQNHVGQHAKSRVGINRVEERQWRIRNKAFTSRMPRVAARALYQSPNAGEERCKSDAHPRLSRSAILRAAAASLPLLIVSRPLPAHAALVEEEAATQLFEQAGASVAAVHIRNEAGEGEGLGSGIVWDSRGSIVTNYHVIKSVVSQPARRQAVSVTLSDVRGQSQEYPAVILGTDGDHDLAVLHIDAPADTLRPIRVGTSNDLRVGQSVFAIGSPFGFGKSLSGGVISGINRAIESPVGTIIRGAIQTDAAVSRGNSGGPLLDSSGRLVGINTSSFTRLNTGRSSGVNFALPIDLVMSICPNLIVSGTNRRA